MTKLKEADADGSEAAFSTSYVQPNSNAGPYQIGTDSSETLTDSSETLTDLARQGLVDVETRRAGSQERLENGRRLYVEIVKSFNDLNHELNTIAAIHQATLAAVAYFDLNVERDPVADMTGAQMNDAAIEAEEAYKRDQVVLSKAYAKRNAEEEDESEVMPDEYR